MFNHKCDLKACEEIRKYFEKTLDDLRNEKNSVEKIIKHQLDSIKYEFLSQMRGELEEMIYGNKSHEFYKRIVDEINAMQVKK